MAFRFLITFLLFPLLGISQSVTIGQGAFGGTNVYGPMYSTITFDTAFSRHAYIYPSSLLGSLQHGDSINSIEFYAEADVAMSGSPNFKIYLRMVSYDTFPAGNLNWKNESNASGMVLVYDGDPASLLDGSSGFKNFIFNKNKFKIDTSGNRLNLEILLSYDQLARQASNTFWVYESSFSVSAFKSVNEGKINYGKGFAPDTTRFSDTRKPFIKINFPRYSNNLGILKTYCLGRVPLLAGVEDSIKVLVENEGKQKVKNAKLYLKITGANHHLDSLTIDSLSPWIEKIYTFGKFKPDSSGDDNVMVSLGKDDFDNNNYDTLKRQINYNVFSHCDPFKSNAGGIGFNGSTGDFVAKFFTDTGIYINQVSVDFSSSGRGFRVGIWDDDASGGFPGTVLFMSDSLTSKGGTYILPVLPRIKVNGGFFVGIRQNTPNNVAFSFQDEDPVRPGAFYFTAPMGNTSWVPFSPGFPYKFNIQPRIQVADDVAPLSILFPASNQDIEYSLHDSIGPQATIFNYGFADQTTPFDVECKISNIFGIDEYKSVKQVTLNSGQTKTVFFDTAFKLYNLGTHKITVSTLLGKDKISDNNVISHTFKVSVKHDIGADIMFTPADGKTYEYKADTIQPTVRITNFGTVDKNNFKVTFRIKNDTSVIHSETITQSLAAGKQQIITFSKYVPKHLGDYTAECFTVYKDSIPFNDTVRSKVSFQKSNDVGPIKIDVPLPTSNYTMGGFFFPKLTIKNFGNKTQFVPFRTHMYIYGTMGQLLFDDTISTQLGGYSETQLAYKRYNIPNTFGKYRIFFETELGTDQEPDNDTLTGFFKVVPNRDLTVTNILLPANDTVISELSIPFKPVVVVKNLGSQTLNSIGPVILKIFRNSLLVFEDSITGTGNLSFNSSSTLTFKSSFTSAAPGVLTCKLFSRLSGDLVPTNDTLSSKFRITRDYDLALDTTTNFAQGHVFNYENTFFKPQIIVKNYGAKSYITPFSVVLELFKNDTLQISKTVNIDSLPRLQVYTFFQDNLINLYQTGQFELCATIVASLDIDNSNDKFCWEFSIDKPFDLSLEGITFPDKANYCYKDKIYSPKLLVANRGSQPIINTLVDFKVFETTNVIWSQNMFIDLLPGETKLLKFDSTLSFNFVGTAWARAVGHLLNDFEKLNDTAVRTFSIAETSSLKNILSSGFNIYPNPSNGIVTINTPNDSKLLVSIYNLSGQSLFKENLIPNNRKIELDLTNNLKFGGGIYLLKLQDSGTSHQFKLVLY